MDGDTTHREQDFGYEVIAGDATLAEDHDNKRIAAEYRREAELLQMQQAAVDSGERGGFLYRGTPERERRIPSRNKRKQQQQQQNRYSQETAEQVHALNLYAFYITLDLHLFICSGSDHTRDAFADASAVAPKAAGRTPGGHHRRLRGRGGGRGGGSGSCKGVLTFYRLQRIRFSNCINYRAFSPLRLRTGTSTSSRTNTR